MVLAGLAWHGGREKNKISVAAQGSDQCFSRRLFQMLRNLKTGYAIKRTVQIKWLR